MRKEKSEDAEMVLGDHIQPNPEAATRGPKARELRRKTLLKQRVTIRLDAEVIEQFKALAPDGCGYQGLINEALRDWLSAGRVTELVRAEIEGLCDQAAEKIS